MIDQLRVRLCAHLPRRIEPIPGFRASAVLVPLLLRPAGPTLLLIERGEGLAAHAGQIAFPGGKLDPDDADLVSCALREAEEEVALPRGAVEVLGVLDQVPTPSQFVITPVVGLVAEPPALAAQAAEVAAMFEVSLASLADPKHYEHQGVREWMGIRYDMHAYHAGGRTIWGATARVLHQLLGLVDPRERESAAPRS